MTRIGRLLIIVCLALGMAGLQAASALPALAATDTVTNCNNSGSGSLPAVVGSAASGDTIAFTPGLNCSGASKITLTSPLTIGNTLTIDGSGATIVLDGNNTSELFVVNGTLNLKYLTLQHGKAQFGGAINNNAGTLNIANSTLSGNSASGFGGAIYNGQKLTITDSTLDGNTAPDGGAIENNRATTTTAATVANSAFYNNSAGAGGAVENLDATLTITASTFAGNSANDGGAIYQNQGALTITASTLAGNSANTYGGALFVNGLANIGASIVANNAVGNCSFVLTSAAIDQGYNLESGTDCGFTATGSHQNTNPQFAAAGLANNGGPTPTIALASTSPAIDQIPTGTLNCVAGGTDQRGSPRPDNSESHCDIGAYEFQDPSLPTPTLTTTASAPVTLGATGPPTLTDSAGLSGGTSPTGSITFRLTFGGTTVYTATDPVSGNGSYGASHALPATGTITGTYTWSASYSGDTNNAGAHDQGGTGEQTVVSPASPGLTTAASPSSPTAGQTLTDSATLSGAYSPTGSIVFTLHQGSCTGTAVDTETVSVSGNGAYSTPAGYPNAAAGSYDWVASYSGDGNNHSATSSCEPVTVSAVIPSLTITPTTASVSEGATSASVATFTDPDNNTDPTMYQASIAWGDNATGTCSVSGSAQPFTLSCTHSGAFDEGSTSFTVSITDSDSSTGTATGSIIVSDAALTAGSAATFNATEGQQFSGTIGGFTDANTSASAGDFTVSITWGDGSPTDTSGTVTGNNGSFSISGTHTYAEKGNYPVSVTVTDDGGSSTIVTGIAAVGDAPLSSTSTQPTVSATEGSSFSGLVGTFTDANPSATTGDYSTVTINWGDATSSNGTVTADPSIAGHWDVSGSHTYTDEGSQTITVNVTDVDGNTVQLTNPVSVQDASLTKGSPVSLSSGNEGQSTGTVSVGTFTDTNPGASASDFTVSIAWGDTTSSDGTVQADASTPGQWDVIGSHTYSEEGSYAITATVTDKGGSTASPNGSITVSDAPLTLKSTAGQISLKEGSIVSPTLATFTDANPGAQAADYTASIDWGDGSQPSTGTVQADPSTVGLWDVTGSHTYPEEGSSNAIKITITDDGGSTLTPSTTAVVGDALLTAQPATFNATEGGSFSGAVGFFSDANSFATTADFTNVSIDWGDGSSTTSGTVTGPTNGVFTVTGSHTYADGGSSLPVTITVKDDGGSSTTIRSTSSVADPAPSLNNDQTSAQAVEYSDPIQPVTIKGQDTTADMPLAATVSYTYNGGISTSGLPSGLTMSSPSGCNSSTPTCSWTVSGSMNVAPGTYAITVNAAEANAPTGDNVAGSTSFTITVGQEAAMATYSGSQVFSTSSPSSGSYTINLAATIQDVGGSGEKAGNITHATVTFVNRDANNAPLSGCVNLPVGLVSSSDTTTGSASCTTSGTLTSSQMSYGGTSFALGIIVGYNANGTNLTGYTGDNGWYTDNSSAEDAVLTITVPLSSNVANGGGWILLQHSSGQDAGDANSHNNFGMTFKYNKGGTNPQGHFNAIFLHTVNGVVHTYQIQSNSISSFSVDTTKGTASINTKASLTDITNPGSPVSVDGGALLTINMTKTTSSFPGSIGIQLNFKSGGIYYSSNWTGATTSQTTLGGGHLTVS